MKLEFYSVDELDHFLDWAYGMSVRVRAMRAEPVVPGVSGSVGDIAFDIPPAADGVTAEPGPSGAGGEMADKVPETSPEPVKRKRRTKAEIEADDKAAAEAEQAKAQGSQDAGEASLEAARATLRDKEPTPAGTNPFNAAPPPDHAAPAAAAGAQPDDSADTTVTPFQHLTRAREFIAKHGMPKYNESFAKASLDVNVMAYTAEQRALHLEALTALEGA